MVEVMTSENYFNWAAEYRQQVESIEKLIQKKKRQINSRFKTTHERAIAEKSLSELYEMKSDCIKAEARLSEQARTIREKEG